MPTLEEAKHYIDALDLTYIIESMCSESYALPRWTEQDANHCAMLYKRFLFLMKKYQGQSLVPTKEIDEFWHNHILFTEEYVSDCSMIFGRYLHHRPATKNDSTDDLISGFKETMRLYEETFQEPLTLYLQNA